MRRVYDGYDADPRYRRMWGDGPARRFMLERKWALIDRALGRLGVALEGARVLDLGCGDQGDISRFARLGVCGRDIVAFDLNSAYAARTRNSNADINAVAGDAVALPFRDRSFGVVYQSTMLSSLIDIAGRRAVFREVDRVLGPGGVFISYDVRYRNPWNPDTRPLKENDLAEAFMGWRLAISSVTGIPQLLRLLAPISIVACRLIEAIPPLRTHLLAIASKRLAETQ